MKPTPSKDKKVMSIRFYRLDHRIYDLSGLKQGSMILKSTVLHL